MGSFTLGAGATLGNKVMNGGLRVAKIFLVAGFLRSGFNELAEQAGHPDDDINLIPGTLYYGWKNVTDVWRIGGDILEEIKDDPNAQIILETDKNGQLANITLERPPEPEIG